MSLSLMLSVVLSRSDWACAPARVRLRMDAPVEVPLWHCAVTGEVDLGLLVKVVSARSPCKFPTFPFRTRFLGSESPSSAPTQGAGNLSLRVSPVFVTPPCGRLTSSLPCSRMNAHYLILVCYHPVLLLLTLLLELFLLLHWSAFGWLWGPVDMPPSLCVGCHPSWAF